MEFEVIVGVRAARQMERAVAWWRENRLANPELLAEEFRAALASLRSLPDRATGVPPSREPVRRRLITPRTGYVIIYCVRPRLRRVEISSIVDARRRR
jgi:plasmid stabilization system protein ParE